MAAAQELVIYTRSTARTLGIPLEALTGPTYTKLFYDCYVPGALRVTPRLRAQVALRLAGEEAHVSHHTAVRLWGGTAPESPNVHLSSQSRETRSRRDGITAHVAPAEVRLATHRGVRMSTPAQALLDMAAVGVSLVELVIAGDSLVKVTKLPPQHFVEVADAWTGRRAHAARAAARLIREGVDSPMETRLRLLIVLAGLPEPQVDVKLRGLDGEWQQRLDLAYPELKIIVEYDGRQHATDGEQWGHDIGRREVLDQLGWRVVIVRSEGIYRHPERTLRRIAGVLGERGARVPASFHPRWSRHFPGGS